VKHFHTWKTESNYNLRSGENRLQTKRSQHSQECNNPRRQCFCDLWPRLLTFDPKINGFPELIVKHFYVKFGDPSCSDVWDIVRKNRQAGRRTNAAENTTTVQTDKWTDGQTNTADKQPENIMPSLMLSDGEGIKTISKRRYRLS